MITAELHTPDSEHVIGAVHAGIGRPVRVAVPREGCNTNIQYLSVEEARELATALLRAVE